jgi:hypothetical protein
MPYTSRTPGGSPAAAHTYPISRAYAGLILVALAVLILMHRLFGSISIEVGAR